MFRAPIKSLYLIALLAVATVIVSQKVYETHERHASYDPVASLKYKVESDLSRHIEKNLSDVFNADSLSLSVKVQTNISSMKDLNRYKLKKINVLSSRRLSAEEWGTLKTSTKVFLRSSGLADNLTKTKFAIKAKRQYLSMENRKWLGAIVLIAIALMITCLVLVLHSRWLKLAMKKLIESRAYTDDQIKECRPTPYDLISKVDGAVSTKNQIDTWRNVISELRQRQLSIGTKNSLASIECKY